MVTKATEPTNIIWENIEVGRVSRFFRAAFVMLTLLVIFVICFSAIVVLKQRALKSDNKYMEQDCAEVAENYGPDLAQQYAIEGWFDYYQPPKGEVQPSKVSGVLDCFCKAEFKRINIKVGTQSYTDSSDQKQAVVCREWLVDYVTVKGINISISMGIVIINVLLKFIIIKLVEVVRQDTKSKQMNSIKIAVFLSQFFNTGLLLLLSVSNLSEHNVPFLSSFFQGPYTDLNSNWFKEISPLIVTTMVISMFMPIIEFLINYSMKTALRCLDRKFKSDYYITQKKNIQLYIDTYSGPDFVIHYRFSQIMNIVFVCMLYGTALPILYPIGLLSLIILHISERL